MAAQEESLQPQSQKEGELRSTCHFTHYLSRLLILLQVRGDLKDELDDAFPEFMRRTIPRHWRNRGIDCLIYNVSDESRKQPALVDPADPRKRARYNNVNK